MASQEIPNSNQKSGGAVAVHPKSDVRHWKARLFKNGCTRNGERIYSREWSVRISHAKHREQFNLRTANIDAGAALALKIYRTVVGAGWESAMQQYKPETVDAPVVQAPAETATIGQLIQVSLRLSSARRESTEAYAKALRRIAAGALGMDAPGKYSIKGGAEAWRAEIDAVSLDALTPAVVMEWKNAFLKAAGGPQERSSAAVTVNSLLRNSKALLSKRIRPFLEKELHLPASLWFDNVPLETEPRARYRSTMDAGEILKAAVVELKDEPEPFKALLLTLVCGLRRSEADSLQWDQLDFNAGTLDVRDTDTKALKSAHSGGTIALDPEVAAILAEFQKHTTGPYVLETPIRARKLFKEHKTRTYRCDATHAKLLAWLRAHGVDGKRPMHTLRKEIGSIIAREQGIFAASRYLRHSDIGITARIYADPKLISAGLGGFLKVAGQGTEKP